MSTRSAETATRTSEALEERILWAAVRGEEVAAELVGEPASGRRLGELASWKHHALLPEVVSVCRGLEQRRPGSVLELPLLESQLAEAIAQQEEMFRRSEPVLGALASAMPVLFAKGAHLTTFAYRPDEPRLSGDVDIYVRPEDVERACDICAAHGLEPDVYGTRREIYRQHRGQFAIFQRGGGVVNIDLHWWLNNSPLHSLASRFTLEAVWEHAVRGSWRGIPVWFPSHVDGLLLNAMHMSFEHWFQKLRFFIDHRRILKHVDLGQVVNRAREVRLATVLQVSLRLTEELTGISLPPSLYEELGEGEGFELSPQWKNSARELMGLPSRWTRFARWSVHHRFTPGRFLVRVREVARIYDLADPQLKAELARHLSLPDAELFRRMYITRSAGRAALLHPLALLLGALAPSSPTERREERWRPWRASQRGRH